MQDFSGNNHYENSNNEYPNNRPKKGRYVVIIFFLVVFAIFHYASKNYKTTQAPSTEVVSDTDSFGMVQTDTTVDNNDSEDLVDTTSESIGVD